ncbi:MULTISPECIES: magnesium transporter CorA family protein [unclassified Exiguobacterium]|uniref:magnesium transporter CorA family protein n=1 Tax=Exiguobacterium TaxID=33986 RepID=UPI001BE9F48E|nr:MULTISPECIES: magnesium transporter CorA family protein [unclassified Exiguobacterium]
MSWKWYTRPEEIVQVDNHYEEAYTYWLEQLTTAKVTKIIVEQDYMYGSLTLDYEQLEREPQKIGHYFVTRDFLWTIGFDDIYCQSVAAKQYDTPIEAFYDLLAEKMDYYFHGIDEYEERLMVAQREMSGQVPPQFMNEIFGLRSEIERWSDTVVPYRELLMAGREAFLDMDLNELRAYRLAKYRVNRLLTLIEHYQEDIIAMTDLAATLSNFRGNEIMKALTVFTALTTPVVAFGAVWGMNFKQMPELEWPLGYLFAWLMIIGFTVLIYFWLKQKNWIGSLLQFPNQIRSQEKLDKQRSKRNKQN